MSDTSGKPCRELEVGLFGSDDIGALRPMTRTRLRL